MDIPGFLAQETVTHVSKVGRHQMTHHGVEIMQKPEYRCEPSDISLFFYTERLILYINLLSCHLFFMKFKF